MREIEKINLQYIENFKLYIGLLKNDKDFTIVGILIKNDEVMEYCETIALSNYENVLKLYDVLIENKVFPSHFYNIMDDMYI